MTAARLIDEIAELPLQQRYPEGVWRVPIEVALAHSSSAYVGLIRKRQAKGDYPFTDCAIWIQERRFYAEVYWPKKAANDVLMIVFPLDLWPWESREVRPAFGLRERPST